jgi:hypothetical protein
MHATHLTPGTTKLYASPSSSAGSAPSADPERHREQLSRPIRGVWVNVHRCRNCSVIRLYATGWRDPDRGFVPITETVNHLGSCPDRGKY